MGLARLTHQLPSGVGIFVPACLPRLFCPSLTLLMIHNEHAGSNKAH